MLSLALILLLFSTLLFQRFSRSLYENIDDLLRSKAEGIAQSINTYWDTETLEIIKDQSHEEVFSKINNINFTKIAQHWVQEKSNDPELMNIVVMIFDSHGYNIASSGNAEEEITIPQAVFVSILRGKSYYVTKENERIFIMPVFEKKRVAYIVWVARPLSFVIASLNRLRTILLILIPITVIITGLAGAFLAKKAFDPVDSMINTIHQITAENLKMKITIPKTNDEIQRLAETFNNMLQRLDHSFSTQRQFINDLSHEFKTPLTILKGELEVTLKKFRSPEEYASVLSSSLEEIDKLNRMINNLLTLARFDAREIPLTLQPLELNHLIENVLSDIKILAQQKNINMEFCPIPKIEIKGDEAQLKRVLLNLIDNAIKYTPEGGMVTLSLGREDNQAVINVADTGTGIPAEELLHIFDRFYRVDKARSTKGFGLGLSIAKSIIDLHKGAIKVTSIPGRGAAFTVSLPLGD
jgi:two-component system, OmpR family, sensor kinase